MHRARLHFILLRPMAADKSLAWRLLAGIQALPYGHPQEAYVIYPKLETRDPEGSSSKPYPGSLASSSPPTQLSFRGRSQVQKELPLLQSSGPAADKLLVWDHLEVTVCGSSLVIKAAAKAFARGHLELAICGSNLSSSLPLARRLLAGIHVLPYGFSRILQDILQGSPLDLLCFAVKIFINFLVAQIPTHLPGQWKSSAKT